MAGSEARPERPPRLSKVCAFPRCRAAGSHRVLLLAEKTVLREGTCCIPGRRSPSRGQPGTLGPLGVGDRPWGSGWGATSETAALERETPLPCRVLFVYRQHYEKSAIPAKPAGHTFTNAPATLEQEGSGSFSPRFQLLGQGGCLVEGQSDLLV